MSLWRLMFFAINFLSTIQKHKQKFNLNLQRQFIGGYTYTQILLGLNFQKKLIIADYDMISFSWIMAACFSSSLYLFYFCSWFTTLWTLGQLILLTESWIKTKFSLHVTRLNKLCCELNSCFSSWRHVTNISLVHNSSASLASDANTESLSFINVSGLSNSLISPWSRTSILWNIHTILQNRDLTHSILVRSRKKSVGRLCRGWFLWFKAIQSLKVVILRTSWQQESQSCCLC